MFSFISVLFIVLGSVGMLISFMFYESLYYLEWEISFMSSISLNMSVLLDWKSFVFSSFVLMISGAVLLYSEEYMAGNGYKGRFLVLMILFVISMILLIYLPNLLTLLLGWDGLGLVSYLLVIYYMNKRAYNSGMITIISNRVGDACLLIILVLLLEAYSWDTFMVAHLFCSSNFFSMVFMLGMFTKSAQFPFSAWLPAAMAAPTPVSSLVHSSTLVTAGVYMLIRYSWLLENNFYILILGSVTSLMAGICALYETDIKKIIALSTLSQLGVMVFSIGLGNELLAFFHLIMHSMFKALLFLCAGSFIHSLASIQDIRMMGGISNMFYFHTLGIFSCNMSLMGFPYLAGFYSKDLIYEYSLHIGKNFMILMMFLFGILLTSAYSMRLMYLTVYLGSKKENLGLLYESKMMTSSMILLYLGACFNGGVLSWLFFSKALLVFISFKLKILSMVALILGGLIWSLFKKKILWLTFCVSMWGLLTMSSRGIILLGFLNMKNLFFLIESGWLELYGGKGVSFFIQGPLVLSGIKKESDYFFMFIMGGVMWSYFLLI